jgi:hypothetical protein
MRQIKINNIGLPDKSSHYLKQKQHCVFLGNETRHYFSSFKDAKCFLVKTNKFLNSQLAELNYLVGVVYCEYRKIWFYLSDSDEKRITNLFELLDHNLNYAVIKSGGINGNYFAFKFLLSGIINLSDAAALILFTLEKKKYYSDYKRVQSLKRQILFIKRQIMDFGKVDWDEALE